MKRNLFAMLMAAAMLLSMTGCGGGEASTTPETSAPEAGAPMEDTVMESITTTTGGLYGAGGGESVYERTDAKLIRRCEIGLQTTEFDAAVEALYALVEGLGGYFENAYTYTGGYRDANARRNADYVIRIPAEKYLDFQKSVGELAYVTYSNESTEDIGVKYYDTQARLEMLRTKQDRLLNLLEKAQTMEDIITLESALGEVEYEVEQLSSTLNRYDALVNYSTFTVNLNEVSRVEEKVGEKDSLGTRMKAGLISSVEGLVDGVYDMLIWLSYHIIGVAVFAVAVVIGVVVGKKRMPKVTLNKLKEKTEKKHNSDDLKE